MNQPNESLDFVSVSGLRGTRSQRAELKKMFSLQATLVSQSVPVIPMDAVYAYKDKKIKELRTPDHTIYARVALRIALVVLASVICVSSVTLYKMSFLSFLCVIGAYLAVVSAIVFIKPPRRRIHQPNAVWQEHDFYLEWTFGPVIPPDLRLLSRQIREAVPGCRFKTWMLDREFFFIVRYYSGSGAEEEFCIWHGTF